MRTLLVRGRRNLADARSLGHAFRSLRHRNYRLFWIGQTVSFTGAWMQIVAQSWLVLRLAPSPLALGALTAVQFAPILLFSLGAGVVADRLPKRRLLLVTQSLMGAQALTLAALAATGHLTLPVLFGLTALLGLVTALDNPTRQAFQTELVPETETHNAIALSNIQLNAARIVGPTLGAALLALIGPVAGFTANALSYAVMVGCLALLRPVTRRVAGGAPRRLTAEIAEGLRFVARTPDAVRALVTVAALSGFGYNFTVMLPLIARDVLHAGPAGFGVLAAAVGIGSMGGALVIAQRSETSGRLVTGSAAAFSLALFGVALAPSWTPALLLLAALGVPFAVFAVSTTSLLQRLAAPEMRGRVMSIYSLVVLGVTPVGSMAIGALAGAAGVHVAVAVAALVCGAGAAAGALAGRHIRARRPAAAPTASARPRTVRIVTPRTAAA